MNKKLNHKQIMENHPHPHLYIEKKRRRFVFYKRLHGKEFIRRIPFRQIKTFMDYDRMRSEWDAEYKRSAYEHLTMLGYGSGDEEDYENEYLMRKYM